MYNIILKFFNFPKGYEDWLRHKADKEVNNRPTKVVREGRVQDVPSKNVKVLVHMYYEIYIRMVPTFVAAHTFCAS